MITTSIVYVAGSDGAGLNDFVSPSLDVSGAPYGGPISELEVKVNGTIVTSGFAVTDDVITFDPTLSTGDVLEMRRVTPTEDSLVVFPSPVRYSPVDNNKSITQLLYNIQDLWGYISSHLMKLVVSAGELVWDFGSRRLTNVAEPTEATDVATLQTVNSAVANALITAGLGTVVEGTLAEGSTTINLDGDVSGVLLMVAGSVFHLRQGILTGGGHLTYVSVSNITHIFLDEEIYGGPHQYIAVLFVS